MNLRSRRARAANAGSLKQAADRGYDQQDNQSGSVQQARYTALFRGGTESHGCLQGKSYATINEPPTEADYTNHLAGARGLGLHLLLPDDTCWAVAGDVDRHDLNAEKIRIEDVSAALIRLKFPALVFRSKNTKGIHLWVWFSEPVSASLARQLMMSLRRSLARELPGLAEDFLNPKLEIFPRSDHKVTRGPWINLPYFNADATTRYCVYDGRKLSLAEFLDQAEAIRVTPDAAIQFIDTPKIPLTAEPGDGDPGERLSAIADAIDKRLGERGDKRSLDRSHLVDGYVTGPCIMSDEHTPGSSPFRLTRTPDGIVYAFCFGAHCSGAGLTGGAYNDWSRRLALSIGVPMDRFFKTAGFLCPPDPSVLRIQRDPAPAFPLSILGPWESWCLTEAQARAVPVDFVAMALFGGAAGAIGNRRWIRSATKFEVPTCLWVCLVSPPSGGRTPAQSSVRNALAEAEKMLRHGYEDSLLDWKAEEALALRIEKKWKVEVDEALKLKKLPLPPRPKEAVVRPKPRRPVLNIVDSTEERILLDAANNPHGLIIIPDELTSLLGQLTRSYSGNRGNTERPMLLKSWDGEFYRRSRVKDEEEEKLPEITHLTISQMAGIQPERLNALMFGADHVDGYDARYLYTWPELVPFDPLLALPKGHDEKLTKAFKRLVAELGMPVDRQASDYTLNDPASIWTNPVLPLTEEADTIFMAWQRQARAALLNADNVLSTRFDSWVGKVPSQMLRLMGVLVHLRWSVSPRKTPPPTEIEADLVNEVIAFAEDYLIPMTQRTYNSTGISRATCYAALIARAILERKIGGLLKDGTYQVNLRLVARKRIAPNWDEKEVTAAFRELEAAGWLRWVGQPDQQKGGRPGSDYEVNPAVWAIEYKATA